MAYQCSKKDLHIGTDHDEEAEQQNSEDTENFVYGSYKNLQHKYAFFQGCVMQS